MPSTSDSQTWGPQMSNSLDILTKRDRKVGSLYRFDAGSDAIGVDTMAEPSVDLTRMSATVVINTPTVDRQGDSLLPEGCDMEEYKRNPIVLWEHGAGPQGSIPIGKSEDEHGVFSVVMDQAALTATCFFSQTSELARQVFSLVSERIIRGASVRARPIDYVQNAKGLLVKLWELEEWSWVAIPCNPDAVAKAVSDKAFMGRPLEAVLLKSLTRVAPKSPIQSVGWTPPKEATMKSTTLKKNAPEDEKPEDQKPEDKPAENEAVPEEEEAPVEKKMLPGAIALTGMHDAYKGIRDALKAELDQQENPAVREYMQSELEHFEGKCAECEGKLKEAYPDHKPEESGEEDEMAKSLRAYFAKSQQARLGLRGFASRLDTVLKSDKLTKAERETLKSVQGYMVKSANEAKKLAESPSPDLQKQLDDLSAKFKTLSESTQEINQLLPARRK